MNIYIITGTSSGIGGAIARHLVDAREGVITISRRENIPLSRIAKTNGSFFRHYAFDLTQTGKIPELMEYIFTSFKEVKLNGIALVNNAGTIDPIGPSGKLDVSGIEAHLKTNLVAPAILINEFIRLSRPLKVSKSILNISSGAAHKPYAGWSN